MVIVAVLLFTYFYRFRHLRVIWLHLFTKVHREFRKPLIVMAPKKLLRFKDASSSIREMGADTMFNRVIAEVCPRVMIAFALDDDPSNDTGRLTLLGHLLGCTRSLRLKWKICVLMKAGEWPLLLTGTYSIYVVWALGCAGWFIYIKRVTPALLFGWFTIMWNSRVLTAWGTLEKREYSCWTETWSDYFKKCSCRAFHRIK